MAHSPDLRLVIVTPERTVFDATVSAVRFPMYDGQFGVLPGRAPLLGRLGAGELRATTADGITRFYIEGGFVQVRSGVVSILTAKAVLAEQIPLVKAEAQLEEAKSRPARGDEQIDQRERDQHKARQLVATARAAQ